MHLRLAASVSYSYTNPNSCENSLIDPFICKFSCNLFSIFCYISFIIVLFNQFALASSLPLIWFNVLQFWMVFSIMPYIKLKLFCTMIMKNFLFIYIYCNLHKKMKNCPATVYNGCYIIWPQIWCWFEKAWWILAQ